MLFSYQVLLMVGPLPGQKICILPETCVKEPDKNLRAKRGQILQMPESQVGQSCFAITHLESLSGSIWM